MSIVGVRHLDMINACPECDSHQLSRRGSSIRGRNPSDEGKWRCADCGNVFDDPNIREARSTTHPKIGLAVKLLEIGKENDEE